MIGWDFRSKILAASGSEAAVMAGMHIAGQVAHRPGGVYAAALKVEFRGFGRSEPAVPMGRAVLCGAPDVCGTARVVNEMTCLGSAMTLGGPRPDGPNALGLDFKSA